MNKIINKFLLTGDKFMPELNQRQPGFTYSASEIFTKHPKRIKKFRETGNLKHLKLVFPMMQHILIVKI